MTIRPRFQTIIDDLALPERLASFRPVVIGTPPLGLATEASDIDIACTASDLAGFGDTARLHFGDFHRFALSWFRNSDEPSLVASFDCAGWTIELFCQEIDVENQAGVRHFRVEQRLLDLEPSLRQDVLRLKRLGIKTEPAFARLLKLQGDPYDAMLDLETETDDALRALIDDARKKRTRPEPGFK